MRFKVHEGGEWLPAVTVEFEAALQTFDAAFDLGQVVGFAASGTGGFFGFIDD
jgi:hypothetical protein